MKRSTSICTPRASIVAVAITVSPNRRSTGSGRATRTRKAARGVLTTPALVYAVYRRRPHLLLAIVPFTAVDPVFFPPPERTDKLVSRAVLAERAWLAAGNGTVEASYPNLLNALDVPTFLHAPYATGERRPVVTALATAASMALELWWRDAIVARTASASRSRPTQRSTAAPSPDSTSKKPGNDTSTCSPPSTVVVPSATSAAIDNAITIRWSS